MAPASGGGHFFVVIHGRSRGVGLRRPSGSLSELVLQLLPGGYGSYFLPAVKSPLPWTPAVRGAPVSVETAAVPNLPGRVSGSRSVQHVTGDLFHVKHEACNALHSKCNGSVKSTFVDRDFPKVALHRFPVAWADPDWVFVGIPPTAMLTSCARRVSRETPTHAWIGSAATSPDSKCTRRAVRLGGGVMV